MGKSIVIVESPTKAKTINKFLGSSYAVCSSMGHVRDLPAKKLAVDIEHDFTPMYEILPTRKDVVNELRKNVKNANAVYLAPDPDREGEAIAWHLYEVLKIPDDKVHRVTFNEITRSAVQDAFKNPGSIDMNKVNAQQARRILDRLVGYQISPLLWKKVTKGLSAGRVQSVAVRLIVEREKEIKAFKPEEYWKITAELKPITNGDTQSFASLLFRIGEEDVKIHNEAQATTIVNDLNGAHYIVSSIKKQKKVNQPPPPFITSLLQQQASIRLRMSAKRTMQIAQQLYEGVEIGKEGSTGLITYMRTDSFRVAEQAITSCRTLISKSYGKDYLPDKPNVYAQRKGAQGAHEAIRPTYVEYTPDSLKPYLTADQHKLYELIWNRFVASQMTPALYAVTDVEVSAGKYLFKAKGRELLFAGHTILSGTELDKDEQGLPNLSEGQSLELISLTPTQHFTQPPPRYSEATLVKALEKKGIGRPSTYAAIISTIQERGYVKQENRVFYATELGIVVTDKLIEHFPKILDVEFTSRMESQLDKIEESKEDWIKTLKDFYGPFKVDLDRALKEMKSIKESPVESNEKCQLCGKPMVVRMSKTGKFLGCSGFPKCKNTMPLDTNGARRGTQAVLGSPEKTDQVCEKCGNPMVIRNGSRGKFLACSGYPKCKNTKSLGGAPDDGKPRVTEEKCEKCGSPMIVRTSRMGKFLGCSGFPKCRNIKPLPTGIKCPKEGCGGELVQRKARKGKKSFFFYGCSNYPKCDYTVSKLPAQITTGLQPSEEPTTKDGG
ncbi:MAG TPA: type I DNA topoisomerase [Candidatus Brocadiia bacterium]|nr:type I DNA topoisomerase [Planctomycetota bacterium]MDO8093597.1 type I DNA topoisomerase [Candidatus Brocadiales bacterium]